ncbi:MAG: DUF72 domain-containing protein [Candidatus Verstraetearchaeota archaeon]|nr:DUF72 domain-containing protein [Candidatus Verstraetearchaeota archaeon]
MEIKVGTCGWSIKGGMREYFRLFNVIELQSTFYRLHSPKVLRRYREHSSREFEFVVKAWQAITHPISSPTWRRSGKIPKLGDPSGFGHLRPTPENQKAWNLILQTCEALRSRFVLVQTPPSFVCNETNRTNMSLFFSSIDRKGLIIGWEPRGDWNLHPEEVKKVCCELSLVHVVDPFRRLPATTYSSDPEASESTTYFRLHGIGGRETNYGYRYTEEDLVRLASIAVNYAAYGSVYVMFNNVNMGSDALRFKQMLNLTSPSPC